MSEFNLPDPIEDIPTGNVDLELPEGLEPNPNEVVRENKSKKWIWIVLIALVILLCCCCVVGIVMIFSYTNFNAQNIINEFSTLLP